MDSGELQVHPSADYYLWRKYFHIWTSNVKAIIFFSEMIILEIVCLSHYVPKYYIKCLILSFVCVRLGFICNAGKDGKP